MNKILKYISFLSLGLLGLASCEINDPVDDMIQTGQMGPNVYLEVPNKNLKAGLDVDFHAEYWSLDDQFKALELWYSLEANYKFVLASGINSYSYKLDSVQLARENQMVVAYEHNPAFYDKEKAAYVLDDAFPVSYTLAPTVLQNEITYDDKLVKKFFTTEIIDTFYVGLYETLDYKLMHLVLVERAELLDQETLDTHYDEVDELHPDTGEPIGKKKILKEESKPVLFELFKQVPLSYLVYNAIDLKYLVTYIKEYKLHCSFRVVNGNDVEVFSELSEVKLN